MAEKPTQKHPERLHCTRQRKKFSLLTAGLSIEEVMLKFIQKHVLKQSRVDFCGVQELSFQRRSLYKTFLGLYVNVRRKCEKILLGN